MRSIYLHVDKVDGLADGWRWAALTLRGPEGTDAEKREGAHMDPDGNLVDFGSPVASHAPR